MSFCQNMCPKKSSVGLPLFHEVMIEGYLGKINYSVFKKLEIQTKHWIGVIVLGDQAPISVQPSLHLSFRIR